ncbi:transcription termination factor 1 isoform X2 [Paroedura picta]|uniref:transcription termination factor 1 isoform X2 n=1 Tax=Paroedura picta TaxID=143630 RepID=UPI004055EAE6
MTNTAEESCTDRFQILDLVKKKKKKRKLGGETHGPPAEADFPPPLSSDNSSIFSWRFDDQASEGSETPQKKSKKKTREERSDSQLDNYGIAADTGIAVCKPKKKKKKKKLSPGEPVDSDQPCVPLSQGKASTEPKAGSLGNGDWTDGGAPVKKKRAKEVETSKVSAEPTRNRTDPTSFDEHEEASHSSAEDSQVELFVSSSHSGLSQKKAATKRTTSIKQGSPIAPKKPHKHKTSSDAEDSDSTDVPPKKLRKHKKSRMEDSDTINVAPRKHKKSSGVEDNDSTDVTPKKPHKHKKSGVEDYDSSSVAPRKPRQHRQSGGEDSDTTNVAPRKHKKYSVMEDPDSTNVTPRKPRQHRNSSVVEDSDSASVTPRKPHQHRKSSVVEDSDSASVTPRKPRQHRKSSVVEDSDSASVAPRKPRQHRKSSAVEDSDSTSVTPRKPRKYRKSSGSRDPDSTDVTPRKPHKHRKSSAMEDSDNSDVGLKVEGTVQSVTDQEEIKNERQAKRFPVEESSELPTSPERDGKLSSKEPPGFQSFFIEDNELLDFSELVIPDLDTATQELEEFIPHVRNLSVSAIKQLARRDLVRFKNFKRKGIAVKFGKFTTKENEQLKKNVEAFLQESGIESAEKLLFTHRFPEEKAAISRLKTQHLFGLRIAEGIPRPWRLVYYRARKIFDPNNYSGRYSDKEKRKLLKYQAMYGNNWKKISGLMSRSSHSVALKYSQIKSGPKSGPWSKTETKKLIQAVEETLQETCKEFGLALEEEDESKALSVVRENLYKGIPWMKVEAKVATRHWRQCKQKWLSVVTKRMSKGQVMAGRAQNLQFKINLIERLYALNIEDANMVDWEVLCSIIGDVPPDYIQRRFYKLKATYVPLWNQKTFPEIVDHLYQVTLPKLKRKRGATAAKEPPSPVKEQRKVFRFRDIFEESSDELTEESEGEEEGEAKAAGGRSSSPSF